MNKRFWGTVFTLTGTIIGAGILGLPYVFAQTGFFVGMFWLMLIGMLMIYVNLCIGEVVLRTRGNHHLPGLARMYLGRNAGRLMFFALVFGIYSALLAYLIGEGESFSKIIFGSVDYALYFGVGFWIAMTFMFKQGMKDLKKLESRGVLAFSGIIVAIFIWLIPRINVDNYSHVNLGNFFLPFGVVLFALLGYSSIPELRREITGSEKYFKRAIVVGIIIPIVLYALFSFTFVGVLGESVPKVATFAFGNVILILGIFTMSNSLPRLEITFRLFRGKSDFFPVSRVNNVAFFFLSSCSPSSNLNGTPFNSHSLNLYPTKYWSLLSNSVFIPKEINFFIIVSDSFRL